MPSLPSRGLFALEPARAVRELAVRGVDRRLRHAAPGDGHPVLVMPGFTGSDLSTRVMRRFLRGLGYHAHSWGLGRNWGPSDHVLDGLGERFRALIDRHERPISLIGHSLGGVYARELAKRAPDHVRQVITLGSPVRWMRGAGSRIEPLYRAVSGTHSERARGPDLQAGVAHALDRVPLTAICSRTDGVVGWDNCVVEPGDLVECIEVPGSHSGLIFNANVLQVVADRLAQPEGRWSPFVERPGVKARVAVQRRGDR